LVYFSYFKILFIIVDLPVFVKPNVNKLTSQNVYQFLYLSNQFIN